MVSPDELLHRAIMPDPKFWDNKSNRVTSALFKDSLGVSVDRNAGRNDAQIKQSFLKKFKAKNLKGEARIMTMCCLCHSCRVKPDPTHNSHHALILGQDDSISLTGGQAKRLAKTCTIIEY